jgi:hypothetical protein
MEGYAGMIQIFLVVAFMMMIIVVGVDARRKRRDYLRGSK